MVSLRGTLQLALALLRPNTTTAAAEANTVRGVSFPSLTDATLDDLTGGLDSGLFTTVELTKAYIARIEQVNDVVHAVTEINPDALQIAAELDAQRANGDITGSLHGLPILVKDNIATADKMNNTAGSYALLGAAVPRDATVAAKLREEGAVILGKASMSQWANFRARPAVNGWSSRAGQVLGGYHAKQDPSGSSSGCGVAVDLGLAAACLGTETDGSIISPSQRNALVGIKPTVGRTSRHMVVPISEHQDSIGPMTRTVRDAARLLQAIAGVDHRDNYTEAAPDAPFDFVAATEKPESLRGARIGVAWDIVAIMNVTEPPLVIDAFKSALEVAEAQGATIVNVTFPAADEIFSGNGSVTVASADFVTNLAGYFAQLTTNPNNVHSLADLRDWTQDAGDLEGFPEHNTGIWDYILENLGWGNTDPRFWPAYQHNLEISGPGGLLGALDRHNLSAVMLPTSIASRFAAMPGAPVITVPLGFYPMGTPVFHFSSDLAWVGPKIPFGVSFLGRLWGEEELFPLAHALEQETLVRGKVRPWIVPSIEIGDIAEF